MHIPAPTPLVEGTFLARYDRFIAAVRLGDRVVEAHCVNPGRMEGLIRPGCKAWVSQVPEDSPRKLRYTLELLEIDGTMVGANTVLPNQLAETLLRARLVPGLKRFRSLEREVRYGERSRVDILLRGAKLHWVEVKNCHLVYPDGGAYFPDSVSTRAADHLGELAARVRLGDKASVLFVVQRDDAQFLRPSALHDPAFARAAYSAAAAGVQFRAVQLAPSPLGFRFMGTLPVDLRRYDPAPLEAYREALSGASGWTRRGGKARASAQART